MIKLILFTFILPFAQQNKNTPLSIAMLMSEYRPVTEEYIDFSRCSMFSRTAMAYETTHVEEAAERQTGDSLDIKKGTMINMFPNPVTGDNLFIDMNDSDSGDYEIRVYNILGRDIIRQSLAPGRNRISIGILDEGIYFVDIVEKGRTIRTVKLIRK